MPKYMGIGTSPIKRVQVMTQRKSIESYRRPEVSTTLCYDWIDISEIDNYIIKPSFLKDLVKQPYLEFKHLIFSDII